jgi:hypothetical protein
MGITLIGGLISSTFLTLFAVPVFYTYFDDFRNFLLRMFKRFMGVSIGKEQKDGFQELTDLQSQ